MREWVRKKNRRFKHRIEIVHVDEERNEFVYEAHRDFLWLSSAHDEFDRLKAAHALSLEEEQAGRYVVDLIVAGTHVDDFVVRDPASITGLPPRRAPRLRPRAPDAATTEGTDHANQG